jgi:plastocyanin
MQKVFACIFLSLSSLCIADPLNAATLQVKVQDAQGAPLANAVVTLQGPPGQAPAETARMDQIKQQYVPQVLAVHTGTPVSFPNKDNIRHQVYSFSQPKRFELRLYEGTPSKPELFDKPGLVVLGCNIHDWMLGYIYVTDDPWFAVTNASGAITFAGLPAGHYKATLWHPRAADQQAQPGGELDVPQGGAAHVFSLAVQPAPGDTPQPPAPSAFGNAFKKAAGEAAQ